MSSSRTWDSWLVWLWQAERAQREVLSGPTRSCLLLLPPRLRRLLADNSGQMVYRIAPSDLCPCVSPSPYARSEFSDSLPIKDRVIGCPFWAEVIKRLWLPSGELPLFVILSGIICLGGSQPPCREAALCKSSCPAKNHASGLEAPLPYQAFWWPLLTTWWQLHGKALSQRYPAKPHHELWNCKCMLF